VKVDIIHFHDRREQTVMRIGLICGALLAMTAVTAGAQQRLVQVGGHAGVLDDGRGFAGGQFAVRILRQGGGYVTGSARTASQPGNIEIFEAGLRPILLSRSGEPVPPRWSHVGTRFKSFSFWQRDR